MKTSINIAKCLRVFFGVARTLTMIMAAFVMVASANGIDRHAKDGSPHYLPVLPSELNLRLNERAIRIQTETSDAADIRVGTLVGTVSFNSYGKDTALAMRVRWEFFAVTFFGYGSVFLLFGFLRHLCANLESGEIFTDANLRLVRNIGRLLVVGALVGTALQLAHYHFINGYLIQHATITGLNASLDSGFPGQLHFSYFITGLLVLLIAEAFRQGLALKKESELTV